MANASAPKLSIITSEIKGRCRGEPAFCSDDILSCTSLVSVRHAYLYTIEQRKTIVIEKDEADAVVVALVLVQLRLHLDQEEGRRDDRA